MPNGLQVSLYYDWNPFKFKWLLLWSFFLLFFKKIITVIRNILFWVLRDIFIFHMKFQVKILHTGNIYWTENLWINFAEKYLIFQKKCWKYLRNATISSQIYLITPPHDPFFWLKSRNHFSSHNTMLLSLSTNLYENSSETFQSSKVEWFKALKIVQYYAIACCILYRNV